MTTGPGIAPRYWRILDPDVVERMRRAFPAINRRMLLIWRLGLGWTAEIWPAGFGRLMVIEHLGRRSGTRYRTPVNFTRFDGGIYCCAGFGPTTDWYRNVLAHPDIAVWLPDGRWTARAEEVTGGPGHLGIMRSLLADSGFAARAIGLDPRAVSDEYLAAATTAYRLLRITPLRREGAPDGPGDLAWVWWLAGLAFLLGRRWRRRAR